MTGRPHDHSERLHEYALELSPGGVHSNVRLATSSYFFERGEGAWLWDADGNDYVDYLLGQGPNFLGHAPAQVNDAVARAMRKGSVFGAQNTYENQAAELLLSTIGWADQVRFGVSGTECVQAALRTARAATGRTKFVRFEGQYHGWLDNVLIKTLDGHTTIASEGQLASHLTDCVVLPYNDVEAITRVLHERGDEVAAVILEPMMCNSGAILPREGYLEAVRKLCTKYGAVLIFDEVITGFRIAPGGAAERFGVSPDLAVYGKAMGGGWPVAALAGRADLLKPLGTGEVTHAGTFNGSVAACAAVIATLDVLRDESPHTRIESHGNEVMKRIRDLGHRHGLPLRVQGLGMAFHVSFGSLEPVYDHAGLGKLDLARYRQLVPTLAEHGIWVADRGIWYVSAAHGELELEAMSERMDAALATATR